MNQPDPTETTETARALLYRHGLPEDILDGALCLHAQELAEKQRAIPMGAPEAQRIRELVADAIDPTLTAAPALVVPQPDPTTDRRDRYKSAARQAGDTAYGSQPFYDAITTAVMAVADAEQAELRTENADRLEHIEGALNRIRDKAEVAQVRVGRVLAFAEQVAATSGPGVASAVQAVIDRLRAVVDGEQLPAAPVVPPAPTSQTAEAALTRVREWVTSDVVTARNEFGSGYREAQRDIRDLLPAAAPAAGEQPDNETPDETGEQRADREETERDHAAGSHQYCDQTCEVEYPSDQLRNFILAKGYPGTAGMLDELLRRAAAPPAVVPQPEETDRIVAYSPGGRTLRCPDCRPNPLGSDWRPLAADDLKHGGICTVCGADVLIPLPTKET